MDTLDPHLHTLDPLMYARTMKLGTLTTGQGLKSTTPPTKFTQIKIDHDSAAFGEPVGKRSFDCVALGLIRTRILWPNNLNNLVPAQNLRGIRGPVCKSKDAIQGVPTQVNAFPWQAAGFTHVVQSGKMPPTGTLSCDDCLLKEFKDRQKPECSSSWVIPLLSVIPGVTQPYYITVTASSIKNVSEYLKPFRDNGTPLYSCVTKFSLRKTGKGSSVWSTVSCSKAGQTDEKHHYLYSSILAQAKQNGFV